MSEAKISVGPWERRTYIESPSPFSGGMTVGSVRAFLAAIDAAGIPDSEPVHDRHANDTRHLVNLTVQYVERSEHP